MKTKRIEVAGKQYTLTANRKIIQTLNEICPELLVLAKKGELSNADEAVQVELGVKLLCNLDELFYSMIKPAHPEISREKSNEILDAFDEEYEDVQEKLLEFAMSVFQEGNQNTSKKKLNW